MLSSLRIEVSEADLTVEFDTAVGFPEGIFGDTLVYSEIGLAHNLDAQFHHHFVCVVYQNRFVFTTFNTKSMQIRFSSHSSGRYPVPRQSVEWKKIT